MTAHDFWRIYREVYLRRWLVLAIFGSCLGVVLLGCAFLPRFYRASAYVMPSAAALSRPVIPGAGAQLNGDRAGPADLRAREEMMATLVGLAQTAEVRQRAGQSLGLGLSLDALEKMITVEPATGSIIRITALSRARDQAVPLANGIAHQFAEYYRDLTSSQAKRNREFLQDQLKDAEAGRERAEADLQAFKGQQGEAALPMGTAENPFLSQFYALRAEMDATRSQLRSVEGRLAAVTAELGRQAPSKETATSTTDNPVTRELQDELAKLERELLLAQSRYTEKHRKVRDLKVQIADVKERLSRELDRMVTHRTVAANPTFEKLKDELVDLTAERAALEAKVSSLSAAMAENERRAGKLADSSVALLAKTREYDDAQARYERVKMMLDQAKVEEKVSATAGEIQVVDEAKSPVGPVTKRGPSLVQLVLLGLVMSVGLGVGTALALAFLDNRVKAREDLGRDLELPVPAVIPALVDHTDGVPLARITELQPLSPHAEAYRFLRTEVMFSSDGRGPLSVLLVATARPGQGGSTTAVNLAIALAETGKRVVLVDADLRRPVLHRYFDEANDTGLATLLLNGGSDAGQALRRTGIPTLLLLPAGPPSENPAALLSSERMQRLLSRLREHCDYVVIDTPSASTFADAAMLGPLVDGVVLVMRANQPVSSAERRTRDLFTKVGANVIGVVLNDASPLHDDSFSYHYHYYSDRPALPPGGGGPGYMAKGGTAVATAVEEPTADADASPSAAAVPEQQATDARPSVDTSEGKAAQKVGRPAWAKAVAATAIVAVVVALAYAQFAAHRAPSSARTGARATTGAAAALPVTVVAVVKEPVDVRVERDGELLYAGPLTAGQQLWQGAREVTVWASQPDALELTVNGKPAGTLGRAGAPPVSRRFTAEEGSGR